MSDEAGVPDGPEKIGRDSGLPLRVPQNASLRPHNSNALPPRRRSLTIAAFVGVVVLMGACSKGSAQPSAASVGSGTDTTSSAATIESPSSTTATSSTTPADAPSQGTELTQPVSDEAVNVVANLQGSGFTVLSLDDDGGTTAQAYDSSGGTLALLSGSDMEGFCGLLDVNTAVGRELVVETVEHSDAQGIDGASNTQTLTAFDTTSGNQVWARKLAIRGDDDGGDLSCPAGTPTTPTNIQVTLDGAWVVYQPDGSDLTHTVAVDLSNGEVHKKSGLYGTVGNYIVADPTGDSNELSSVRLTLPDHWSDLGTLWLDERMLDGLPGPDQGSLAPAGSQLPNQTAGSPTLAAVTPDGRTIIGVQHLNGQHGVTNTSSYALPSTHRRWKLVPPRGDEDSLVALSNTLAVIQRSIIGDPDSTDLLALDPTHGKTIWKLHIKTSADVCALTSTELVVLAHDQLIFLDAKNGDQLSYEDDAVKDAATGEASCPTLLAGGLTGLSVDEATGVVTQLATP